ncbi:12394_t:CDS:10 [Acaulospora morrowiae]|uniref:12394_t:CDS:1 n=1 Tax=Acaulospora morrowiae TaxID=94023 RepID=A0A9N8VB19_9GLOM|nr:12394_t:CDS:10 [Acaulospora morrowiae]
MSSHAPQVTTKPRASAKEQPNRLRGFLAGIISGFTKLLVGHPFGRRINLLFEAKRKIFFLTSSFGHIENRNLNLPISDTVKVRLQTSGKDGRFGGPIHCLKQTIRMEGFRALYKGATPPLVGWGFMDSVMLGSLHNYRLLLQGNDPTVKLTILQHAIAGAGAGWTVSFIASPIEHLKARLQVQYDSSTKLYNGPIDCARKLIKNNGIQGLWIGLSGTLLFRSFFFVMWGSYELYSRILRKTNLHEASINFLAGGLGATNFWLASMPFDTIKNKYMTQPDVKPRRFPTLRSVALHTYREDGLKGFYRGIGPCLLRSFPTNASSIMVFELAMRLLKDSGI